MLGIVQVIPLGFETA